MFNLNYTLLILTKTLATLILILLLLIKLITVLGNQNKYKYFIVFLNLILLSWLLVFKNNQYYLLFFLILTELTSLYLVIIITMTSNTFKCNIRYSKNKWFILILLLFICNPYFTQRYVYFDFYSIEYVNNFIQFLILFLGVYFSWSIFLIVMLTVFLIKLLTPLISVNKVNISYLFSTVVTLINQIPANLNGFTSITILKWK